MEKYPWVIFLNLFETLKGKKWLKPLHTDHLPPTVETVAYRNECPNRFNGLCAYLI